MTMIDLLVKRVKKDEFGKALPDLSIEMKQVAKLFMTITRSFDRLLNGWMGGWWQARSEEWK